MPQHTRKGERTQLLSLLMSYPTAWVLRLFPDKGTTQAGAPAKKKAVGRKLVDAAAAHAFVYGAGRQHDVSEKRNCRVGPRVRHVCRPGPNALP